MPYKKINYFSTWFVVLFSTTISVLLYILADTIWPFPDFLSGLIASIIIPIAVSFPISFILTNYHKKIKKAKEELQHLNKINKELFSIISHDIRGPLANLKSITSLVKEGDMSIKESTEYISLVSDKLDSLNLFLDELLRWSTRRIKHNKFEKTLFNSYEIINSTLELYSQKAEDKNITINTRNISQDIESDRDSYFFVFRNLLQNSIKFTPNNGTINISTEKDNNFIKTTVEDTGIGISKENIDTLLKSNEWFSSQGTNNETGVGFGLKTSVKYLRDQGGDLLIKSELNKGTKAIIITPVQTQLKQSNK